MRSTPPPPPLALVVFLENTGYIIGRNLSPTAMNVIDFVSEEYAKLALRFAGVYSRYDSVIILEDDRATGPDLRAALIGASRTHRVDLLILAHGLPGAIIGYKGLRVGAETFTPLIAEYRHDPVLLNLHMVWQMNCYGATLAPLWRELGATVVNGSVGVNWVPEPALSTFLHRWMRGNSFGDSVLASQGVAERFWGKLYRPPAHCELHPRLESSRQIVMGCDTHVDA
jgi:hypothetical protein